MMKKTFLVALAAITTVVATMVATSACWWLLYQPVEPKCLRDE